MTKLSSGGVLNQKAIRMGVTGDYGGYDERSCGLMTEVKRVLVLQLHFFVIIQRPRREQGSLRALTAIGTPLILKLCWLDQDSESRYVEAAF